MYFTKKDFDMELRGINGRINLISKETRLIGKGKIICRTKGDRAYYSEKIGNTEKGISRNRDRIYELIKKEFLQNQLNALEHNRSVIEYCRKNYIELAVPDIIDSLSKKYRDIPVEDIILGAKTDWGKRPYVKNPFYKEDLQYMTTNGILVRSKSEREIANSLESLSIQYQHDSLIKCGKQNYYADFLIQRPDGSLLIWEHFGRENDKVYMAKNRQRIIDYISIGFHPWDNLVWTLESDLKDSSTIKKIIDRFILCDMNQERWY